ncbi:conserved hypothetical protein [Theileria equi strain WA]|uniref:Helicase C-terminal domain-containing protein n=1 Tax=Theileria equi strain WA TaxID=1537102 RepID=L1LGL9_THEEQ|nr:conserved hypothetical protein [Theileria equi strain WA]EKX74263.1 conserved hypothetical protein [Theileria equi strain WA]|eukprot:XP_004833715.1 conserved hypothetical protein [Theileria equi strain WA]
MTRLIVNALGVHNQSDTEEYSRFIFYNEVFSGLSVGYLVPMLFLYSLPGHTSDILISSVKRPHGTLLIVCDSDHMCHDISHLILILKPSLHYFVLDSLLSQKLDYKADPGSSRKHQNRNTEQFLLNLAQEKLISGKKADIIIASYNRLEKLLSERYDLAIQILDDISCLVIDDISKIISFRDVCDYHLTKVLRKLEKLRTKKPLDTKFAHNFHILCITNSLSREVLDYSKRFLTNFWLYNFKLGTKERLLHDNIGDVLKLGIDFGDIKRILTLDSEDNSKVQNCGMEHSFCKLNKKQTSDRVKILKHLVFSYLDLPTFAAPQFLPPNIKNPIPNKKCIVFASNRQQLNYLSNLQEFSSSCVCLGKHLDVYERAKSLANFANGKRPIMFATDSSIFGCEFDDVAYIINYHPPKTSESYVYRAEMASKNTNAICITLYDNDQYNTISSIIGDLKIEVSIHTVPSKEYMLRHDLKWLKIFTSKMINSSKNILLPYISSAETLIKKYGDDIIYKCIQLIVGRNDLQFVEISEGHMHTTSILSGKRGYTAVLLNASTGIITDEKDIRAMITRFIPDYKGENIIGSWHKIDTGFIVDVSNRYLGCLLDATKNSSEISVEVATSVPKIVLTPTRRKSKKYTGRLPWNATKIRRLPSTKCNIKL